MYEAFYGLNERPFNLTPDPKFLFLSDHHKEAFAHLLFGIKNQSGFVMVTGEIGTGKTTICRNLLNKLDEDTDIALVFNPPLEPVDLLKKICAEFGIECASDDILALTEALNAHLLEAASNGRRSVLLIDEAQNLSPSVLEQIRLLSNLETETEKLLQIVLIGQPELLEKLYLKSLRQLNQRITARYHLKQLGPQETIQYIAYRLHVAGGRKKVQFSRSALRHIHKKSKGTPRVINAICDRALLIGYTQEKHLLDKSLIKQAAKEVSGSEVKVRPKKKERSEEPRKRFSLATAAILLLAAAAIYFVVQDFRGERPLIGQQASLPPLTTPEVAPPSPPEPTEPPAPVPEAPAPEEDIEAPAVEESAPPAVPPPTLQSGLNSTLQTVVDVLANVEMPSEAPPPPTFQEMIAAIPAGDTLQPALQAIYAAWEQPLSPDLAIDATLETLTQVAANTDFSMEPLKPALEQLITMKLPALAAVEIEESRHWIAVLEGNRDELTLVWDQTGPSQVSRETFSKVYAGEALIYWKDAFPDTQTMFPGMQSPAVKRLKTQLRQLNRLSEGNTSSRYDSETAGAVAKLQAETGLTIDGISGRQVRMVLTGWLPKEKPAPAKPAVVAKQDPTPPEPPAPAPAEIIPATTEESTPVEAPPAAPPAPVTVVESETAPEAVVSATPEEESAPPPPAAAATSDAFTLPDLSEQIGMRELPPPASLAPIGEEALSARKETTPPVSATAPLAPIAESSTDASN